jgi:uncharacterized membrane protein YccC
MMNTRLNSNRFNVRQMMVFVGLLCVWFACLSRGNHLVGTIGFPVFGILSGLTLLLVGNLVLRWDRHHPAYRMFACLVTCVVALVIVFPIEVFPDLRYYAKTRERQHLANSLQDSLIVDPRFEAISVTFIDPPLQKGEWLQVTGQVSSERAKAELLQILEAADDWYIKLNIRVEE